MPIDLLSRCGRFEFIAAVLRGWSDAGIQSVGGMIALLWSVCKVGLRILRHAVGQGLAFGPPLPAMPVGRYRGIVGFLLFYRCGCGL
jgi:hypothetical protein